MLRLGIRNSLRIPQNVPRRHFIKKAESVAPKQKISANPPSIPARPKPGSSPKKEYISTRTVKMVFIGLNLFLLGLSIGSGNKAKEYSLKPPHNLFPFSSTTKLEEIESPIYGDETAFEAATNDIIKQVGIDNVTASKDVIESHADSYFNTHHAKETEKPRLVVFPASTEEVSEIMKIAHKYRIPVVPNSGLTSIEGNYINTRTGISLDLSRLDQILKINEDDLDCVVQAAVGWQDLNENLEEYNLIFGPDPGIGAQIGGMCATSCSGTNAFKYGTMRENVLSLTVVLADGTIIKTKQRPRKSAAGYNLTGLFIGSEGTLGVITEAVLKLHVKPKNEVVSVVSFNSIEDAANTVRSVLQRGLSPNAIEIFDETMMKYVNESGSSDSKKWLEKPTLFFKVSGSTPKAVKESINEIKSVAKENKSLSFEFARNEEESQLLWSARRAGLWSTIDYGRRMIDQDVQVWTTDVAVPISKLPAVVKETDEDLKENGLLFSVMGHVGDGNIHFLILYEKKDHDTAKRAVDRMVQRALKYEGTCTGEHGVGYGKRGYLVEELGEDTIDLMRKMKFALDPKRILNPDKIFKIDPQDSNN